MRTRASYDDDNDDDDGSKNPDGIAWNTSSKSPWIWSQINYKSRSTKWTTGWKRKSCLENDPINFIKNTVAVSQVEMKLNSYDKYV